MLQMQWMRQVMMLLLLLLLLLLPPQLLFLFFPHASPPGQSSGFVACIKVNVHLTDTGELKHPQTGP